jgi:hypothetical protein
MFRIPEEVFEHQILQFLKLDETSVLFSSSNSLFKGLWYRSGRRNFTVTLSDFSYPRFQKLVQKINPAEQLIVNCNHCLRESTRCHDILTGGFTMDCQPLLPRRLCTSACCGFIPAAELSKVQELSLCQYELTDVNCLAHLSRLSLSYCRGISDVHSLGNIPELAITDCRGIRDISALQNNKKLTIYRCNNISLPTVNFVNVLYLSTDLPLTYDSTTTLMHALSLELLYFRYRMIFLSSTVTSVQIRNNKNKMDSSVPLEINLSNFSQSLKSVVLENISSRVDLTPLGIVEKVQLEYCYDLVNVNGLGRNNKIVVLTFCHNINDLSPLKTVPRVIINYCESFVNCEDLNQVQFFSIKRVYFKLDFSGLKREKGCRVYRLELLDCDEMKSFKGLDEIPFLKITSYGLLSLEGLGGKENKIIIVDAKFEQSANRFLPEDCYSKTFYNDGSSRNNCLMLQLMRK